QRRGLDRAGSARGGRPHVLRGEGDRAQPDRGGRVERVCAAEGAGSHAAGGAGVGKTKSAPHPPLREKPKRPSSAPSGHLLPAGGEKGASAAGNRGFVGASGGSSHAPFRWRGAGLSCAATATDHRTRP